MKLHGSFLRWSARGAAAAALALAAGTLSGAYAAAGDYAAVGVAASQPVADPYSPSYHHSYRHGAVPARGQLTKMRQWVGGHLARQAAAAASADDLNYGGGIDGIGVTTGHEKVYLVLYGSQWGTTGADGDRDVTASGDTDGEAPYLQDLMKGLGTGGELWSGVLTQYCEGIAAGSQTCPAGDNQHVAYPAGGALAGVWADESTASPQQATGNQLGQEAVAAAAHFGNTTAAANRDAQYVIMSPTGTDPDSWLEGGFCAWHDYTGDVSLVGGAVPSPYGDIAFTNLPYITDQGASCGQDFVSGPLDGVSIVAGHEYAETITDQNPDGGWTDSSAEETGDKCAWISPGADGGAFDLATATGSFAMQTTWANDAAGGAGSCEASHAVVPSAGENSVTLANPGGQNSPVGKSVSLQLQATDSAPGQTLTYTATGLPPGLSITPAGLISGTPTATGGYTVSVTVTDSSDMPAPAAFTWAITSAGSGIVNGGFETGDFSGWVTSGAAAGGPGQFSTAAGSPGQFSTAAGSPGQFSTAAGGPGQFSTAAGGPGQSGAATSIVSSGQHSGRYAAMAGSTDTTLGDSSIAQTFTVPAGDGKVSFWYNVTCPSDVAIGWATATLTDITTGITTTPLQPTCAGSSGWTPVVVPVAIGDSYTLMLTGHGDGISGVYTLFDDVTLAPAGPDPVINGGFESGAFSGWTASGAAFSIVSSGQHSGHFAAQAGSPDGSNGGSSIAQTFTAASADTGVAFWYDVNCQSFNFGTDGASATLTDNTAGSTSTVFGPDCPIGDQGWIQVNAPIIAGHSYTLTLTNTDTSNSSYFPTYTLFDDIDLY